MTNTTQDKSRHAIKHTDRPPCDRCGEPGDVKPDDWSILCAGCYFEDIQKKTPIVFDKRPCPV